MPKTALGEALRFLQRICALQETCDLPDHELLERFLSHRDDGAFTFLVRRHGPMILAVGRRVLGDSHEAEDVFQATFLVLARRTRSIDGKRSVGGWLHNVAQRIALRARAQMAARRTWARKAGNMRGPQPVDDLAMQELRSVLDEEIGSLPEKNRGPIVLCYLEGKSFDKAARELGCPKTSLARWLAKGRDLLRRKLERRGITLAVGVLATTLTEMAAATPLPAILTLKTVKAAALMAAGKTVAGGCISAHVLAMAEEATRGMLWIKAKMMLMVVALGVAVGGAGLAGYGEWGEKPPSATVSKAQSPAPKTQVDIPAKQEKIASTDLYGDPLPQDALLRFGTNRLRHNDTAQGVAFSPDGRILASVASCDEAIRLWDMKTGKAIRELSLPRREMTTAVAFSPDGTKLATGARTFFQQGHVRLWDVVTGQIILEIPVPKEDNRFGLAFSPDGSIIATAGKNTRLLSATSGAEVIRFQPSEPTSGVAFSPDGKLLATTHAKKITVWNVDTGTVRLVIPNPADQYFAFSAIFADNTSLVLGGSGQVHIWDVTTGKKLRDLNAQGDNKAEVSLALSADRERLAAAFRDKIVIWKIATGETIRVLSDYYNSFVREGHQQLLAFSPDAKILAATEMDNEVRLWDITTGKRILSFAESHSSRIGSAAFSPDGRRILTGGWEGTVRLWDAGTAKQVREYLPEKKKKDDGRSGNYMAVFSPDGKMIAAGGYDYGGKKKFAGSCRIWDAASGKELHVLEFLHQVKCISFAPDGKSLAIATSDRAHTLEDRIYVFDCSRGKTVIMEGEVEGEHIDGLAFAPDGKTLAAVDQGTLRIWDVATKKQRAVFSVPGGLGSTAFSADGKTVVVGEGKMLFVTDAVAGKIRRTIEIPNTPASTLALSADGRILASCLLSFSDAKLDEYDVSIHLWEILTGNEVFQVKPPPATVNTLAFSPDGRTLVSGLINGTVLTWNVKPLPTKPLSPQDLEHLWKSLAGEDAAKAYAAVSAFESVPQMSIPFLKDRLLSAPAIDVKHVLKLIADLESETFQVRQAANNALRKLGDKASGYLRRALADNPSLELGLK